MLEVVFRRDGEQVARNVQPLQVEPGKFTYRLVRAELDFADYGTVEAHCRVDIGPVTVVPYTLVARPDRADRRAAVPFAAPSRCTRPRRGHRRGRRHGARAARGRARPRRRCSARPTTSTRSATSPPRSATLLRPGVLVGATAVAVRGRRPRGRGRARPSPCGRRAWPRRPGPCGSTAARTPSGVALGGPRRPTPVDPGDALLLLADPFSLPVDAILERRSGRARPAGRRSSAGWRRPPGTPGGNRLVLDGEVVDRRRRRASCCRPRWRPRSSSRRAAGPSASR